MGKIRFAHLSDTHFCREGKSSFIGIPVREHFEQIIDTLCERQNKMDFVIVTGDIVNDGDLEDYRFIKAFIGRLEQKLGAPIFLTIGNHDNRDNFFAGYLEAEPEENYCYVRTVNGLRLIVLDSVSGSENGVLGVSQLAWLRKELATPSRRGTILAFHHPVAVDEFMLGEHCLEDGDALCDVMRGSDVIGVLTGHTHKSNQSIALDAILLATADSVAYSLDVNGDDVKMLDRFGYSTLTVLDKKMYNTVVQLGSGTIIGRYSMSKLMEQMQRILGDGPMTKDSMTEFEKLIQVKGE